MPTYTMEQRIKDAEEAITRRRFKINPEFKSEWVKRLRSGAYKQGTAFLRSAADQYCCLGVACEINVERGKGAWELNPPGQPTPPDAGGVIYLYNDGTEQRAGTLPASMRRQINLDPYPEGLLTGLNDAGATFEQIADFIDANL
jgi:hypothetical protein